MPQTLRQCHFNAQFISPLPSLFCFCLLWSRSRFIGESLIYNLFIFYVDNLKHTNSTHSELYYPIYLFIYTILSLVWAWASQSPGPQKKNRRSAALLLGGIGTRVNWGEKARYPYLKPLQANQTTEIVTAQSFNRRFFESIFWRYFGDRNWRSTLFGACHEAQEALWCATAARHRSHATRMPESSTTS